MIAPIVARNCFIVDIIVTKSNEIELTIESETGVVALDDCVALSKEFENRFDRDVEDYQLTVTSAGLDQPFKVLKQYQKAVGSKVTVSLKGGRRFVALLAAADENGITLNYTAKETVEGKKKKVDVEHNDVFPYTDLTSVIPYIDL